MLAEPCWDLRGAIAVKLLTVREAADLLAISTRKVYQLVAAGKLAHYRIDNTIRIAEVDVENFIAGCRIDQRPVIAATAEGISLRARKLASGQPRIKTSHLEIGPQQLALLRRGGVATSGPNDHSDG
jgi:excisionase family DNA binding protein